MVLPNRHMDAFNSFVQFSDEIEAREINAQYDGLLDRQYGGDILKRAIAKAEQSLTPSQPYAEEFGYEVARGAIRWLNYRGAYLHDSIDGDWRDRQITHQDMIGDHHEEYATSDHMLMDRDVLSFGAYAQLESIRVARERAGQAIGEPLKLEKEYGLTLLANALDGILDDSQTLHLDGESVYAVRLSMGDDTEPLNCIISRKRQASETEYTVNIFEPSVDAPELDDDRGDRRPIAAYTLSETPQSIDLATYASTEFLSMDTLELVRMFSRDENYVFERPSSPIAELSKQSDL